MQPTSLEERIGVAGQFAEYFEYPLPLLVDQMDDAALEAFGAWPERLYVLEADRTVAYKGGAGPWMFDVDDIEDWLETRRSANFLARSTESIESATREG